MDTELDSFFRADVPEKFSHSAPYSIEAFTIVTDHLLDQFPTWKSYWENPDIAQSRDRLLRYYGTIEVAHFEGTWIKVALPESECIDPILKPAGVNE
ncbi:hypothetical protein NCCP2495_25580 [Dietzia sp. NCCP-2495]|nr:hypothetical protein NCCP2495_25580 [Dietzia sp. NCCP-2495]